MAEERKLTKEEIKKYNQKNFKKKRNKIYYHEADNYGDGTRGCRGERAYDFSLVLATTESVGRDVRIRER